MYIVPISSSITPLNILSQNETLAGIGEQDINTPSFTDIFAELFRDVTDTQRTLNADSVALVNGEIDDLHTIYNDMTKAEIAVETFVAIRDACQQSFDTVMQMSI